MEKNLCQWWNTCENAPETELWLKENSNFGRKWDKFQIKAQKSSQLDFIREICWPVQQEIVVVSGTVGLYDNHTWQLIVF